MVGWRWCDICSRQYYADADADVKCDCPVCGKRGTLLKDAPDHQVARRHGSPLTAENGARRSP